MKPGLVLLIAIVVILLVVGLVFRTGVPEPTHADTETTPIEQTSPAPVPKSALNADAETGDQRKAQVMKPEHRRGSVNCAVVDQSGRPRSGVELWLMHSSQTPRDSRQLQAMRLNLPVNSVPVDPARLRITDADGIAAWDDIEAGDGYYLWAPLGRALVFVSAPSTEAFARTNGMPVPNPDHVVGASGLFALLEGEVRSESATYVASCTLRGRLPQCDLLAADRRHRLQLTVQSFSGDRGSLGQGVIEAQVVEGLSEDNAFTISHITPGLKVLQIVWGDSADHYYFIQRCIQLKEGEQYDCGPLYTARTMDRRFTVDLVDDTGQTLPFESVFVASADPITPENSSFKSVPDLVKGGDPRVMLKIDVETPTQDSGCLLATNNASMGVGTLIAPIIGRECTLHGATELPDRPVQMLTMADLPFSSTVNYKPRPGFTISFPSETKLLPQPEPHKIAMTASALRKLRVTTTSSPVSLSAGEAFVVRWWLLDPPSGFELGKHTSTDGPNKFGKLDPIECTFTLPVSVGQVRVVGIGSKGSNTKPVGVAGAAGVFTDMTVSMEPTTETVIHVPQWDRGAGLEGTLVSPDGQPLSDSVLVLYLELPPQMGQGTQRTVLGMRRPTVPQKKSFEGGAISSLTDSHGHFFFSGFPPGTKVYYPEWMEKKNTGWRMDPILLDEPGSIHLTVITSLDPRFSEVPK